MPPKFAFDSPDKAIEAVADRLAIVETEQHTPQDVTGRVLAAAVTADRDSPAADVSAMDGYAIRMSDLERRDEIPVGGESIAGSPPPPMPEAAVVRIFTGAIVPPGAEAVIKREETEESPSSIRFTEAARGAATGANIRRAGENATAGSEVLQAGTLVHAAHQATMANFGCFQPTVFRRVRVSLITTGDEVGMFENDKPQPWQLRNSNRVALLAMLAKLPWVEIASIEHGSDELDQLQATLSQQLHTSDAVILTGGVSMGDYDFVPEVVRRLNAETVFHGLPLRPGKPVLGAVSDEGKLILGLPGNPVSAVVGCRRLALPLLAHQSGRVPRALPCPVVRVAGAGEKTLPLHWMRLVRLRTNGEAEIVHSQGSGDLVSLGASTGFVELPPQANGEGPWPYYAWDS